MYNFTFKFVFLWSHKSQDRSRDDYRHPDTSNIIKIKANATLKYRMNKRDKVMLLVGRVHTTTQVQFLGIFVMIKRTNKF